MILKFGLVNLNKLLNKLNLVKVLLCENKIDVLAINETWLTKLTPDSYVYIDNYKIFRGDNDSLIEKHGVALYVRKSISCIEVTCPLENAVAIHLLDFDIYVVSVYRPPSYSIVQNEALIRFLCEFCGDEEVLILGDFNLPTLQWKLEFPTIGYVRPVDRLLFDCFTDIGLTQVVAEPTHFPSENTLDLALFTHPERQGTVSVLPPLPACSHGVVSVEYFFQNCAAVGNELLSTTRLWSKGNYSLISEKLAEVDWVTEFLGKDVQEQYTRLLDFLEVLIERYVPVSRASAKPPWTLNPPRSLLRDKNEKWRRYKEVRSQHGRQHSLTLSAWQEFMSANILVKNFAIQSQSEYEKSICRQMKTNPKLFHSYIRHKRVGRPTVGPIRLQDDSITDDPAAMAEQFVLSFGSVFSAHTPANPAPHQRANVELHSFEATRREVEEAIGTLRPNSSMGNDGIHPKLLIKCCKELSLPLAIIINSSFREAHLPREWLYSLVIPLYKKDSRSDPLNYRPVSITSVPCKVAEKVIVKHLMPYLEENHLISTNQFGFRSKHSTVDQLVATYDYVTDSVDQRRPVDLVFFDYSKAFDKVCHRILLQKLLEIGISHGLVNWISHFLQARKMAVRVQDKVSSCIDVLSGVPQGSVLGPVLFLVYVNHVVYGLCCKFMIFADDIKLHISCDRVESTGVGVLQRDIDQLVKTSSSWGLLMNADKCVCMRFGARGSGQNGELSPYRIGTEHIKFVTCH